jgi:hypothetical protein
MTTLLWFLLGGILLVGALSMLKRAIDEGKKSKPTDDWLYSEDEYSPEDQDIMEACKRMYLRGKLKDIEREQELNGELEES